MRKNPTPNLQSIKDFFREIMPYLENKPIIREIKSGPVLYVGDLHGFYQNLLDAFDVAKLKEVHAVVFLGDYADRGPSQLRTLVKVMDAFARSEGYTKKGTLQNYVPEENFPFKIIALRGNHEDTEVNARYGFKEELRYTHEFLEFPHEILDQLYSNLPIFSSTKWKTLGVHGGIPKPRKGAKVSKLPRYLIKKRTPLTINVDDSFSKDLMVEIYQTLWNDPNLGNDAPQPDFRMSFRGPNIYEYNKTALEIFLEKNGCRRLVRAHEVTEKGFEIHWNNKLVHIFSASPYFARVKTAAYFLEREDSTGEIIDDKGKCLKKVDLPI
ncbi:MAG: hypothetical protein EU530_11380 [Promethearchaeota archaeon]|nr:MAG: hypothetical protein EU530_11380 [Candidatus Lokiarchaeota archaeon]